MGVSSNKADQGRLIDNSISISGSSSSGGLSNALVNYSMRAQARDKTLRAVQYGSRGVRGVAALLGVWHYLPKRLSGRLVVLFGNLFARTRDARRTFRLLSTPTFVARALASLRLAASVMLQKKSGMSSSSGPPDTAGVFLTAGANAMCLAWCLLDHVRLLQEIGWVWPGARRVATTRRVSFGLFTLGSALSAARWARILALINSSNNKQEEIAGISGTSFSNSNDSSIGSSSGSSSTGGRTNALTHHTESTAWRSLLKETLNVITFAHVSELFPTHDTICGAAGTAASLIDVSALWTSLAS